MGTTILVAVSQPFGRLRITWEPRMTTKDACAFTSLLIPLTLVLIVLWNQGLEVMTSLMMVTLLKITMIHKEATMLKVMITPVEMRQKTIALRETTLEVMIIPEVTMLPLSKCLTLRMLSRKYGIDATMMKQNLPDLCTKSISLST